MANPKLIEFLGVIPARLGSKRLPRKNLLLLNNKELIAYSILSAKQSSLLSMAIVSTESDEIAKVARKHNANVPFMRPPHLATDEVTNIDVLIHAVNKMSDLNCEIQNVVLLQPTSPFRTGQDIDNAIINFKSAGQPSLASVCGPYFKRHPIAMKKHPTLTDTLIAVDEVARTPFYKYNASIYIVSADYLLKNRTIHSQLKSYYVMDERKVDIDTPEDLALARAMLYSKKEPN